MKNFDVKKKKRRGSVGVVAGINNDKERLAFLNIAYVCEEVAKLLRDCAEIIHQNYDSVDTEDDDTIFSEELEEESYYDLEDLQNSSGSIIDPADISTE